MYTRKYGNNLNSEFSPSNLFPKNNKESHDPYISSEEKTLTQEEEKIIVPEKKSKIQTDIESIDISNISSVKLHIS
jgi:hypothetical protein